MQININLIVSDLKKLEDIVFEQNHTLRELREEIALLKSKGKFKYFP